MKTKDLIELQKSITQGKWVVMADPKLKGLHPYHDSRFIVTEDTRIEFNNRGNEWRITDGSMMCVMQDVDPCNATAISIVPELIDEVIKLREALAESAALNENFVSVSEPETLCHLSEY